MILAACQEVGILKAGLLSLMTLDNFLDTALGQTGN